MLFSGTAITVLSFSPKTPSLWSPALKECWKVRQLVSEVTCQIRSLSSSSQFGITANHGSKPPLASEAYPTVKTWPGQFWICILGQYCCTVCCIFAVYYFLCVGSLDDFGCFLSLNIAWCTAEIDSDSSIEGIQFVPKTACADVSWCVCHTLCVLPWGNP